MKRWLMMLGFVLVIVAAAGGLWGYKLFKTIAGVKAAGIPRQTVSTVKAGLQEWRSEIKAVGSLRAVRGADISAEVAGVVDKIYFASGTEVKAGAPLLDMRAGDDRAKLESVKAAADLAQIAFERDQAQFEAQAISHAQRDTSAANLRRARASVAELQALLDKKIIRAPFSGRIGIRAVDEGQYLQAGNKIVTLQTLDPIYVDFSLPEQNLNAIRVGQPVAVQSDAYPGAKFGGQISSLEAKVEHDTRNIFVRATLKNAQNKLLPGMFARITLEIGKSERRLTLPQTAITYNPYGESVFVITRASQLNAGNRDAGKSTPPANKSGLPALDPATLIAKQVFVTVGPKRGDQVSILSGLQAGQEVVNSGQLKLKNGTPVIINNSLQLTNDPDPKPVEE